MKTMIYIGISAALLTAGQRAESQFADAGTYGYDNAGIVVNNYFNHDFHFSSRINRFHRSYTTFSYYSPVFTDTYWYSYQPFAWGMTIYGGVRVGIGPAYNFPVYYWWDNPWDRWWDYGWYGGAWHWNYDPFYYSWWYSPVVININIGPRWPRAHYYSFHGRNRWYNDYSPVFNTYNYYYYNSSGRPGAGSAEISRRNTPSVTTTRAGESYRREGNIASQPARTITDANTGNGRRTAPETTRVGTGDRGNTGTYNTGNPDNVSRGTSQGAATGRRDTPSTGSGSQGGSIRQAGQGVDTRAFPGNAENVRRGTNPGDNSGRTIVNDNRSESRVLNERQGNERPAYASPAPDRRNYGTVSAPSRSTNPSGGATRPAASGNARVQESSRPSAPAGTRPAVSAGSRQSSGNQAVRQSTQSSGGTSRAVSPRSSSGSSYERSTETKSSGTQSNSSGNSGTRRR